MQRTKLHRASTPLKRYTRLRRVSKKREGESKIYLAKRRRFLSANPVCEKCKHEKSRDVHHVCGRYGGNYLNEMTWLALCRTCHRWIHDHPKEARERGWLR